MHFEHLAVKSVLLKIRICKTANFTVCLDCDAVLVEKHRRFGELLASYLI
jgi:hypothetical protein